MIYRGVLAGSAILWLAACGAAPVGEQSTEVRLDQAALLASSCSGCHGEGGSANGIPSLAGMPADVLETKLLAYRDDRDGGSAMHRMARGYSERQIALIAGALGSDP